VTLSTPSHDDDNDVDDYVGCKGTVGDVEDGADDDE
jgi:hypothetical protein